MPRARTFEIWSDVASNGGSRLAVIPDVLEARDVVTLEGEDTLELAMRFLSDAWQHVKEQRIIRVAWDDASFDEWRITNPRRARRADGLVGLISCAPILHDLATRGELIKRTEADGTVVHDFELLGLTPTALITDVIDPAAPTYFAPGTINPATAQDVRFEWETPLSALRELAALTKAELQVRRNATTDYKIDLVTAIGSSAEKAYFLLGKNLLDLKRDADVDGLCTRLYPQGGGEDGDLRTIARARWKVSAISAGSYVELQDPNGGDGPAQFADQFNNLYLRRVSGTLQQITGTIAVSSNTTRCNLADTTGFTVGDLIEFRATAGGAHVTYLEEPAAKATYGIVARKLERRDIPPIRNLVANPQLNGAYTAGLPASWAKVGVPTTSENTNALYARRGGKSLRVQTTAADQGVESAAFTVQPSATEPYLSGYLSLYIETLTGGAKLRVELIDVTNSVTWPALNGRHAITGETDVWLETFGPPNGYDANAVNCVSAKLRIVQEGSGTADFYLDFAQCTPTAELQEPYAGDGAVTLWQAANDELLLKNTPLVSLDVSVADLTRFDGSRWPNDALVLGGTVEVRDPDLSISISTRIVRRERNLLVDGETKVTLDNNPARLTDALLQNLRRKKLKKTDPEPEPKPVEVLAARPVWRANRLFISWEGASGVGSAKIATSTTTFPAAGTGTAQNGSDGLFDAGTFTYAHTVYVTITPYSATGATGDQGPVLQIRARLPNEEGQYDEPTGKRKRTAQYDDLGYALRAQDALGKEAFDDIWVAGTKDLQVGTVASPSYWERTLIIPHGETVPKSNTTRWFYEGAYVTPNAASPTQVEGLIASVVVPVGVEIVQIDGNMYRTNTSSHAVITFQRIGIDGVVEATLATLTHDGTLWQTKTAVLSEIVAVGKGYVLIIVLRSNDAVEDARFCQVKVTYRRKKVRDSV